LPGAKTSEEERAGIEQLLVYLMDGTVQLEHEAAPAGDVRLVVMNQGSTPFGFSMREEKSSSVGRDGQSEQIADWDRIEPGATGELLIDLHEGDYVLTSLDTDGAVLGTATLTVQPQQGLPGSGELHRTEDGRR
jgi:hypothetical protein